jgi:enoyl-CoA hydratase/long-chain 3-hydroxyacyl-CoA dehydrogenase
MVAISHGAQDMMDRLAASGRPVVAAINGNCLGGGLETALACTYRIATTSPKTVLGVPEVMLGILPGAGGTQRLPRKVGIQKALDLALTGRMIKADRARKMGLVDQVVDPYALEHSAIQAVKDLAAGRIKPSKLKRGLVDRALEETQPGRDLVFSQARKTVVKKSGGHYPAPLSIIDCIRAGVEGGHEAGSRTEREKFGDLGMTPVSKSLISIFHGQTKCKKNPYPAPEHPIGNVTVLGAGLMGSGIAAVSLNAGHRVILKDLTVDAVARGLGNIHSIFASRVKRRSMTQVAMDTTVSKVVTLSDADSAEVAAAHLSRTDVVIEAVFESLDLKRSLISELDKVLPPHAVIATNTSALPIADIATAAKDPSRVVGMHYFSPVDKMPLLEVVTHATTSPAAASAAVSVGLAQGKTVIVVKDGPGFYTTRILSPFMGEAAALMTAGVPVPAIDAALRSFGFPVGPMTLLDEVGIDVAAKIAKYLSSVFGERMGGADASLMDAFVAQGFLGRKSGKGVFLYDAGSSSGGGGPMSAVIGGVTGAVRSVLVAVGAVKKPARGKPVNERLVEIVKQSSPAYSAEGGAKITAKEMQERLVLRMVNEAAMCLEEGILASPVDGDIGAIFGLGFPPHLGGPFRYIDALGAPKIVEMLRKYEAVHGVRFAPAKILVEHAEKNKKFHAN